MRKNKIFKCNQCPKECLTLRGLNKHTKFKHPINLQSIAVPWEQERIKELENKVYILENSLDDKRNRTITEWIQSIAQLNSSVAQAIGEGVLNVRR